MHDHGKPAERFLTAFDVVSVVESNSLVKGSIPFEDAQRELRVYGGDYVSNKSTGAPSEAITENLDAIHGGELDDGD